MQKGYSAKEAISSAKKLFEYIDMHVDENMIFFSDVLFALRDSLYGDLKYGRQHGFYGKEDIIGHLAEEPEVESDIVYAYASGYVAWLSRVLKVPTPSWTKSERSFRLSNYVLTPAWGSIDFRGLVSECCPELAERGIYIEEKSLRIA